MKTTVLHGIHGCSPIKLNPIFPAARLTDCDRYNGPMTQTQCKLTLFGQPVAHSLSPRIQQAFAAQFDLAIDYRCQAVDAPGFENAVKAFFAAGGHGANVTVPHKRAAFELADEPSEAAIRAGVANVLRRGPDESILADNTDGSGLLLDLSQRRGLTLAGMHVLLLGAGGAAHGIAAPLLEAGIESLHIANRTQGRAVAMAEELDDRVQAVAMESLAAHGAVDLLIHATSAGHDQEALELPDTLVDRTTVCCDLSYGAAAEPFLQWAQRTDAAQAFDGLGMLLETAADSFELWFGKRPDTGPVYEALRL